MSLLDKGNADVLVYPDEETTDRDGNPTRKILVTVGIPARAMIQPRQQSGTSARRAEQEDEGTFTEEMYRLRFTRKDQATLGELGPNSEIVWNGEVWTIFGRPMRYQGSSRTHHTDYVIVRN